MIFLNEKKMRKISSFFDIDFENLNFVIFEATAPSLDERYPKKKDLSMSDFLGKVSLAPIVVAETAQPRTTDTQRELSFENLKLLGLGRQIGPKILGAFVVFSANFTAPILVL